ncbi:hypothetical protein BaRGS_00039486 [Batillaria attramentaria]|uniref:Uncharacterized protein n=1 Tax=Batillaria attramentaria TaxID=370345 RepID=A0ABD0J3K5_9CAEN
MRPNTQSYINTRPDQEHVDQLCLSDTECRVQSSGTPGTSSPGSECGCLPGTAELQPTTESDRLASGYQRLTTSALNSATGDVIQWERFLKNPHGRKDRNGSL